MSKEIKFNVKLSVDGKEQLTVATANIDEMAKALKRAKTSAQDFTDAFVFLNQWNEAFRNVRDALDQLTGGIADMARQGRAVTQITGETGAAMSGLRDEISAVAKVGGEDFNEVLRAVNALSKGFGVSMDEALRLVRDGFVSGANAGGDFLDNVSSV